MTSIALERSNDTISVYHYGENLEMCNLMDRCGGHGKGIMFSNISKIDYRKIRSIL